MQRRFGIADFLITLGAVRLTEKFFLKGSSATDEEELESVGEIYPHHSKRRRADSERRPLFSSTMVEPQFETRGPNHGCELIKD
jgi:hypothetical protein